ncbi:MAG: M23 family metallopeptidase [Acetobacterales bacterium]
MRGSGEAATLRIMARTLRGLAFALALGAWSPPVGAEPPLLGLPADCEPGRTCWLVNLFDHDPGAGTRDYACGDKTYDGHDGTDLALRDLAEMARGVAVLAAAQGRVLRVRDGEADHDGSPQSLRGVAGRECGNGVVIDHGDGWETQYCHLRQGGILVRPGAVVARGDRLGFVGMSGRTEFPHVHVALRRNGKEIDPFVGGTEAQAPGECGLGAHPAWRDDTLRVLDYRTGMLFNRGFATGTPDPEDMRKGRYAADRLPLDAPALVLWFELFAPRLGDTVAFSIIDPVDRVVFEQRKMIERDQARLYVFGGRRRPGTGWPAGRYVGRIDVIPGTAHTRPQSTEITVDLQ